MRPSGSRSRRPPDSPERRGNCALTNGRGRPVLAAGWSLARFTRAGPPVAGSLATGGKVMVQKIRKGLLVSALLLCGLTALLPSGCATSRGFGQDVQSLGRNIEKSAK